MHEDLELLAADDVGRARDVGDIGCWPMIVTVSIASIDASPAASSARRLRPAAASRRTAGRA